MSMISLGEASLVDVEEKTDVDHDGDDDADQHDPETCP